MMLGGLGRTVAFARGGTLGVHLPHGGRPLAALLHRSAWLQKQQQKQSAYGALASALSDDAPAEGRRGGGKRSKAKPKQHSGLDFSQAGLPTRPGGGQRRRGGGGGGGGGGNRHRGGGGRRGSAPVRADGEYLAAQRTKGRYITTVDALEELCAAARAAGRIAIDTEFHLEKTYFIELALVQIGVEGEAYCIDPLALRGKMEPLYDLVADPSVQKMLHAASMDLRVFYEQSKRPAANIFDTQIAGALLGHGISGYGELVQMCTGTSLGKGSTMSDWLKRPLDDDQLKYAEDDVVYLADVADDLARQLEERGRLRWFEEECAKLETPAYYNSLLRVPHELFPRLKKVRPSVRREASVCSSFSCWSICFLQPASDPLLLFPLLLSRSRVVWRGVVWCEQVKSLSASERVNAFRLVAWREEEAASQDKPPYFLLKDQALTEVAKLKPSSPSELLEQASRVVHENFVRCDN
jgi:ribonuclease D